MIYITSLIIDQKHHLLYNANYLQETENVRIRKSIFE